MSYGRFEYKDTATTKNSDAEWLENFKFSSEIFTITNIKSLQTDLEKYIAENGTKPPTGIKFLDATISFTPLSRLGELWAPLKSISLATNQPFAKDALTIVNDTFARIAPPLGQNKTYAILNMLSDLRELYHKNNKGRVSGYIQKKFEEIFHQSIDAPYNEFIQKETLLRNYLGVDTRVEKKDDSTESPSKSFR